MHQDSSGGLTEFNAFPFSRCYLTDAGSQKGNKRDVDAGKLTLTRVLDPWFTDLTGQGIIDGHWQAGGLFISSFTTGLTFGALAPVVAPTGPTAATMTLSSAFGGTGALTYTVKKSAAVTMTSPTTVTTGSITNVGGVTTIPLTGLTTATTSFFQATVTDSATPTPNTALSKVAGPVTQP
jgi:hypothetical protein